MRSARILSYVRRRLGAVFVACAALFLATAEAGDSSLQVRDLRNAVRSTIPNPELRAWFGVVVESTASGVQVARVVPGSPADDAGIRAGDVVRSLNGVDVATGDDLDRVLDALRPGDTLRVAASRAGTVVAATARLGGRRAQDGLFRRPVFRLAVVPLRFEDDRGATTSPAALRRLLFEATGRTGAGASVADYYSNQSFGRLGVEGSVLEPLSLPAPRARYAGLPMGAAEGSAFQDAAHLLFQREGGAALADYDGVAFLYGGTPETRAGLALWPHRSTVALGARRIPYYVHGTGGDGGLSIGIHCHEFGHLLGLTDAYGAGHRTGCGDFCLMAIGHRGGPQTGDTSPFSLCAQCRMRLGWIEPTIVDPRTPQRVRIPAVASGVDAAMLLPLDARCDEYALLEVRTRRGFDAELPSEGLLVWHIGGMPSAGKSIYAQPDDLIEAHGIDVFDASLVRIDEIAFPTARARDLTPDTRPALAPATRNGFAPYVTDIVRERDGSVVVTLGVKKSARQAPPVAFTMESPDAEGYVVRRDPITGEDARFYAGPGDRAPSQPPATGSSQERR